MMILITEGTAHALVTFDSVHPGKDDTKSVIYYNSKGVVEHLDLDMPFGHLVHALQRAQTANVIPNFTTEGIQELCGVYRLPLKPFPTPKAKWQETLYPGQTPGCR